MMVSLENSIAFCRRVTRRRARNFYYSFVLLRRAEHDAMCALYAFMRHCDDLSDDCPDTAQARTLIERWRSGLEAALAGAPPDHPVWPAFRHVVETYGIPHDYFRDMIDGVTSDLEPREFASFQDLYRYCYQVASVAGLSVIHILGFESPRAPELAEKCGVAFQLTNILRDVSEDAARGRVYFPTEDLARFGLSRTNILQGGSDGDLLGLMRFEAARAAAYYAESSEIVGLVHPRNQAALRALIEIYRRLLVKIESSGFEVRARRVSLSAWEKALIVARAALRPPHPRAEAASRNNRHRG